jgi:hypothetical protein
LFASSVDSLPEGHNSGLEAPPLHRTSSNDFDPDAYGAIQLPNFLGSPSIKKTPSMPLPLKKKNSFKKKPKKASVVKKV